MRARAQARGVEGPDPNVLDLEAVPRDGVDPPALVMAVLVEVPVMLSLVAFANRTTHWFPKEGTAP